MSTLYSLTIIQQDCYTGTPMNSSKTRLFSLGCFNCSGGVQAAVPSLCSDKRWERLILSRSGADKPKHLHTAESTTQHDTFLSLSHRKLVNSSISAIIKAFWLITSFNWTIPVARAERCLVSSAAEQRE